MLAKINYMGTKVPKNPFIVCMIGAIPKPERPMLLLEHCGVGPLLDWLNNVLKFDGDVEDQMVQFTRHIAEGMQHLHENEVMCPYFFTTLSYKTI